MGAVKVKNGKSCDMEKMKKTKDANKVSGKKKKNRKALVC